MKLIPGTLSKPWGYEILWASTGKYVGKILHINAGHKLSLQHHNVKDETIYLQEGRMRFFLDEKNTGLHVMELVPGDSVRVLPGQIHRMEALETCTVFEVSTPELDDVVRHEDDYGRT